MTSGATPISILRQGPYLIASFHTDLDDAQLTQLRRDLVEQIGRYRSRGVVIDVAAVDVLDSFGAQVLREIAEMARLRGALTVVVGIAPEVAFTMVQLGQGLGVAAARLDLEDGVAYLDACLNGSVDGSLDGSSGTRSKGRRPDSTRGRRRTGGAG